MVQGELNTAVQNSTGNNSNPINIKMYENIQNNQSDDANEKKKKVGNYIISKTIGEGSFAKVRLGYHLITQQMVAVKVINKREVLKRNYLRANLRREACMMQRMQHPHIIQLYEVMETENCYYIVMELIDGIEFVKYLSKKRSLDENETRDYIRQIVSAVDHMHKAKVIHRDIKLQNFMLDQNRNLTIIDFGLSNSLDDRELLNTQCGSPAYAAPESIAFKSGVNMYAMLAGRLPFKVENRSKNLAKLHACILKGFEVPQFLSADCQDLLCRLLDPSPAKRIKMHEILTHPWINYNNLPQIEIVPYKPVVDSKEIRREIVQYLMHKHDYTETDVYDAIVHRKPVALKAIYYLIEKRLKQGLTFPDPDYNHFLLNPDQNSKTVHVNLRGGNFKASDLLSTVATSAQAVNLTKHNSQLLPKRHVNASGVNVPQRSSSQKNMDYKTMFNQMNLSNTSNNNRNSVLSTYKDSHDLTIQNNNNNNNHNNNNNNANSNSPTPDFIASAMNPIKTVSIGSAASSSSNRGSRLGTHHQQQQQQQHEPSNALSRKLSQHNANRISYPQTSSSQDYYATRERYYAPSSAQSNRLSQQIDENFYESNPTLNQNRSINNSSTQLKLSHSVAGSIRSLPNCVNNSNNVSNQTSHNLNNRLSPERNFVNNNNNNNNNNNIINNHANENVNRSASRVSSTSSSMEKHYDNQQQQQQKARMINYLAAKRSMTSCDIEPPSNNRTSIHVGGGSNSNAAAGSNGLINTYKNRQLHMGKAKIELEAHTSKKDFNVGANLKSIGSYLKSSLVKNLTGHHYHHHNGNSDTIKNLNLKNSASSVGTSSATSRQSNGNLLQRHNSNPVASYSTSAANATNAATKHSATATSGSRLQHHHSVAAGDSPANALPRIRINS